jgi:hypothetical protein
MPPGIPESFREALLGLKPSVAWDYVVVTYPDATSEVYTFKDGGSSGIVVGVVTLVYTSSAKTALSSAAKS